MLQVVDIWPNERDVWKAILERRPNDQTLFDKQISNLWTRMFDCLMMKEILGQWPGTTVNVFDKQTSCLTTNYFIVFIRLWPNDQTLLVKYLKVDCQTICLKTLLVKHFCLCQAKHVFRFCQSITQHILLILALQTIFCDVDKQSNIACEVNLKS